MKGIILAAGSGTRLYPTTIVTSKQLLPIYDKPLIYYPLSILMSAGIKDILIIVNPQDLSLFFKLLGDGSKIGISIVYEVQKEPKGLADAFIIGEEFIGNDPVTLILGDNIFWGHQIIKKLKNAIDLTFVKGAAIFAYQVEDPERYGIVEIENGRAISLEEKPTNPKSNYAVTGLYCYDNRVVEFAKSLNPSARNELEITDLNKIYLDLQHLRVELLGRGTAWLDTGTHESMLDASIFVKTIQTRQGLKISAIEEIAYSLGYITKKQLHALAEPMIKNSYGIYLSKL